MNDRNFQHFLLDRGLSPSSAAEAVRCVQFLLSKRTTKAKGHSRLESLRWAANLYKEWSGKDLAVPTAKVKSGRLKEAVSISDKDWADLYNGLPDSPAGAVLKCMMLSSLRIGDVLRLPPRAIYDALAREDGLLDAVVKGGHSVRTKIEEDARGDWTRLYELSRLYPTVAQSVAPQGSGSAAGGEAAYQAVNRLLRSHARPGGGRMFLHRLRRTVLVQALRAGADITTVRDMAGHGSIKTTELYTDEFKADKVGEALAGIAKYRRRK